MAWRSTSFNYNVSKCIGPTLSHKTMWRSNHQQLGGRFTTMVLEAARNDRCYESSYEYKKHDIGCWDQALFEVAFLCGMMIPM